MSLVLDLSPDAAERNRARAMAAPRTSANGMAPHLPLARWLHWIVAALVFGMVASGVVMKQVGTGPLADTLMSAHKMCGVLTLALILVRLGYRIVARGRGRWAPRAGAHPVHRLLYAVAILVPLLGWAGISDFGARDVLFGLTLPAIWPYDAGYADALFTAHAWAAFGLMAAVFAHVAVALRDHLTRGHAGSDED